MSLAAAPARLVEIEVEAPAWRRTAGLEALCERVITLAAPYIETPKPEPAAALLADDGRIQALNARFRGKDAPTNVLSFPAPEDADYPGDIILAYGACAREARARRIDIAAHAAHLLLHGFLHLYGYDHIAERDAERMERVETAVLAAAGLHDPYLIAE